MKKRKIIRFLASDLLEFRIKVPAWLVMFILLLPLIAYGDMHFIGKTNFIGYLQISAIELFILYLGFLIASNTSKINELYEK